VVDRVDDHRDTGAVVSCFRDSNVERPTSARTDPASGRPMTSVTVLVDNDVVDPTPRGLRGEWGFAAAVGDVLFDVGQTGIVTENAARLGVDFDFETVVLSHGHYDHTGGLNAVLARLDDPTVYCHPGVWTDRYRDDDEGKRHYIATPYRKEAIADRATVVEHTDPVEVTDGVYALGGIPRRHDDATTGIIETEDGVRPDDVPDDQALAVETDDGLGLVLGCGHAGLRNTIEYAESVLEGKVRSVVGGTHLVAFEESAVRDLADRLAGRLDLFAGTHCTGATARAVFSDRLPDAFEPVGVGTTVTL
jgi:7,8-dihydropterin-6-yl-methyl-4-(beta-D-ribofuranosyl)aminobenzene 5'-phosphate synthase